MSLITNKTGFCAGDTEVPLELLPIDMVKIQQKEMLLNLVMIMSQKLMGE